MTTIKNVAAFKKSLSATKEISVDSAESEKTETNKIKGHIYIDTDSVKVAPLPKQQM